MRRQLDTIRTHQECSGVKALLVSTGIRLVQMPSEPLRGFGSRLYIVFPGLLRVRVSAQQILSVSLRPAAISQNILHCNNSLCSQNSTSHTHKHVPADSKSCSCNSLRLHYAGVRLRFRLVLVRSI